MTSKLRRHTAALLGTTALAASLLAAPAAQAANPTAAQAASPTAAEAHAIAVQAYIYLYPLVTMEVTRKTLTNVAHPAGLATPMNTFANIPAYPPAGMREVVRPNFDTLYSSAWLDLTQGPVILSAPDTHGRYYLLPMLDMWTDVFASPGWRTTGTAPQTMAVVPPGWTGTLPDGVQRIDAPTPYVWIIGRTKTDGPDDYAAVHDIQAGFKLTKLADWGKPAEPVTGTVDPAVDMKTPPKRQVDTMSAAAFFAYAAEVLKRQPPHITDQPILAQMRRIGLVPGQNFDAAALDPAVQQALTSVPEEAQHLIGWKLKTIARVANGWSMNTDTMGVYGNYYLKRALVAQFGLGANLPEDAIYPANLADDTGKPLDGANRYLIHFDKAALPPVDAFWSVTLYDNEGFQVANALNRFALSSWMPMTTNSDGSLDLYVQHASPGAAHEANWLPAPAGGFTLTMRLYAPRPDALTGVWNPPAVVREGAPPPLAAQ